jgi:hypothetical protein
MKKRFLNIDLHISVIADVINILKTVNDNIEVEDVSLSDHNWVFNKQQKYIHGLNDNWKNLNLDIIKNLHSMYDEYFSKYDGFICCYPVSFVLLFEKYNKPIYVINPVRYDLPFCWTNNHNMINELHNCFIRLQNKNLLTIISNNKADNEYFHLGNPEIKTQFIPSLCLYTNMKWNPNKNINKFLLYSGKLPENLNTNNLIISREKLGRFKWDTLMEFNGIIHFPYEASTMSIFEHTSSEIPLFFPTKRFLSYLWKNNIIKQQVNYWKHYQHSNIPKYLEPIQDLDFWIEKADYYDLEGYYYFDSFEELINMLQNFKDDLYEVRKAFIEKRKHVVYDNYKKLFI